MIYFAKVKELIRSGAIGREEEEEVAELFDPIVEKIINKDNRRKYILKLTKKGDELIPVLKREADHWHNAVGLAEVSEETMDVIRAVARKSYNLVNE